MQERYAYDKQHLYGRKCLTPASCDTVEALLRAELLYHLPEWLCKKATVLGWASSDVHRDYLHKGSFHHQ